MGDIVWVLGAGFPRSLGAPLLNELLSPAAAVSIGARFPEESYPLLHGDAAHVVRWLFNFGRRFENGPYGAASQGITLWRDAEDFLDVLDGATKSTIAERHLRGLLRKFADHGRRTDLPIAEVSECARRLIAAETSAFMVGADPTLERWEPYLSFFYLFNPSDTIISFNYDLSLEFIDHHLTGTGQRRLHIVTPEDPGDGKRPRLLKLHGSVDWRRHEQEDGRVLYHSKQPEDHALVCEPKEIAMGTPGPSKQGVVGELQEVWRQARSALCNASAIVFLGYRFPPSDSYARVTLLGAIRANELDLRIVTVLGADIRHMDTLRLREMLLQCRSGKRVDPNRVEDRHGRTLEVKSLPYFAEDFLSLIRRPDLTSS
jgi:hypothetical protein